MATTYATLAEIKHLFQTRQLKLCLAKCEHELSTPSAHSTAHMLYVHFFLASSHDCLARSTSHHCPKRMGRIIDAKMHYAKAIELALDLKSRPGSDAAFDCHTFDEIAWLQHEVDGHVDGLVAQIHTHLAHLGALQQRAEARLRKHSSQTVRTGIVDDPFVLMDGSSSDSAEESARVVNLSARFDAQKYIDLAEAAADELLY